MLAIADIAGQFDALMRLVERVPEDMPIILLGDLVDRGPYSYEVVEWAMQNSPRVRAVLGNHEHMMVDFWTGKNIYGERTWLSNGGKATRSSYARSTGTTKPSTKHLAWLSSLPLYIQEGPYLFTHAPLNARFTLEEMVEITKKNPLFGDWSGRDGSLLWNRSEPVAREGIYQIFGHNSHWGLVAEEGWTCLDQSASEKLTGILLPSGEILEEPYLKGKEPILLDESGDLIKEKALDI